MNHGNISLNIFDLIDSICRDFRAHWKQGKKPRLEEWFEQVPQQAQPQLFSNLVEAEIRYRRRAGESPKSSDYLKRFPQFTNQIRQAFDESTMGSVEAFANEPSADSADAVTQTIGGAGVTRIGEYEIVGELGRGGMGVVYEACHQTRNNRVALKTLPTGIDGQEVNAEKLHKFRKEFRSLSEINHPNLVGMQTLEVDGSQWFFTMDLIEGEDFLSFVRPNERLDEKRLRTSLGQLATGIIALHEMRIVHRDLKPSNVLVDKSGRVMILDFGLVSEMQSPTDLTVSKSGMFAGTPKYAAPEQMFGERSEASDWYAFGTMLYEALTGQAPFVGQAMELLRRKQSEDPAAISHNQDLPSDLADLADQLLKREPTQRPATAQIIETLQLDLDSRTHGSTRGSSGSSDSIDDNPSVSASLREEEIVLIGREEQLAQLESAKQSFFTSPQPTVVWITGKSGEGKSTLAEKFLAPIRLDNQSLVLSGRCYDRESVPYKAIDCLINPLVSCLRSCSNEQLHELLPSDIQMLAHLFPLLRRVPGIADRCKQSLGGLEERQIRNRAFNALGDLLNKLSQLQPIMLVVDDLQWGDADSAEVLAEILKQPSSPALMLIGSYRIDEAAESSFLNKWQEVSAPEFEHEMVVVKPLTESQCVDYLVRRLERDDDQTKQQGRELFAKTGGNPYFLDYFLETFDKATGLFESLPLAELLARKLKKLPSEAGKLLQTISVAGQALEVTSALEVAGEDGSSRGLLTHMRNERLVRLIGSDDRQLVDTYHDQIRESTIGTTDQEEQKRLHLKFADRIEQACGTRELTLDQLFEPREDSAVDQLSMNQVADLAFHYYLADHPRAFGFQLLAADRAANAGALTEAMEHANKALEKMSDDLSSDLKYRLWMRLGWAASATGQTDLSRQYFRNALEHADSSFKKVESYIGIGQLEVYLANWNEAFDALYLAFQALDHQPSNSRLTSILDIFTSLIRGFCIPHRWQMARDADEIEKQRLMAELYWLLSSLRIAHSSSLGFVTFVMRVFRHGVKTGQPNLMVRNYRRPLYWLSNLLPKFMVDLVDRRAKSIQSENRVVDIYESAIKHACDGNLSVNKGNFKSAIESFLTSTKLFSKIGDRFDTPTLEYCRHVKGFVESANAELECSEQVMQLASSIGFPDGICWAQFAKAVSLARNGQLELAQQNIQHSADFYCGGRSTQISTTVGFTSHSYVLLQQSRHERAAEVAEKSWQVMESRSFFFLWAVHSLPMLIEGLAGPNWIDGEKRDAGQVKIFKKNLRRARFSYFLFPALRCLIQRARGRAFFALGKPKKGTRFLVKAIEQARKLETDYDLARCLLDLAAVQEDNREARRVEAIELLKKMESVIPRAESWLLGDQYDEEVVAPEFDVEAWEKENGVVETELEMTS